MKIGIISLLFICSLLVSEPKEHQSLMATLFVQKSAVPISAAMVFRKGLRTKIEFNTKKKNSPE